MTVLSSIPCPCTRWRGYIRFTISCPALIVICTQFTRGNQWFSLSKICGWYWLLHEGHVGCRTTVTHHQCTFLDICNHAITEKALTSQEWHLGPEWDLLYQHYSANGDQYLLCLHGNVKQTESDWQKCKVSAETERLTDSLYMSKANNQVLSWQKCMKICVCLSHQVPTGASMCQEVVVGLSITSVCKTAHQYQALQQSCHWEGHNPNKWIFHTSFTNHNQFLLCWTLTRV